MPKYWLDANVFIDSSRRYYGFDIAPGFWEALVSAHHRAQLFSPKRVYDELSKGDDELKAWAQQNRGLFVDPTASVQREFTTIAEHVMKVYKGSHARRFLDGADPWLIAHAKADGGIVVSKEKQVESQSKKVKIPNVCQVFSVECIQVYDLLRVLKVKLSLR